MLLIAPIQVCQVEDGKMLFREDMSQSNPAHNPAINNKDGGGSRAL